MRIFSLLALLLSLVLLSLVACGDSSSTLGSVGEELLDDVEGVIDDIDGSDSSDDSASEDSAEESTGDMARSSFVTGRTFMPSSASGFKCQSAETRGGQTVCLLPYQYTLAPFYTKTDHEGNRFSCNIGGDTFDSFVLDAAGTEYPMFIEQNNPFGPQSGISDYFCANYVGTASGNVGRTHVRLTKKWTDFNGQSVSIKVCDQGLCDTLILR